NQMNLEEIGHLKNLKVKWIKLYYKMPIAQMAFEPLSSPADIAYGDKKLHSKYYGDMEVRASMMHKNFGVADVVAKKK
ncbi:MAG TPA: hypothetical protein PK263_04875, partial [bacterium]|nr:hypothetical protein [bacterium]